MPGRRFLFVAVCSIAGLLFGCATAPRANELSCNAPLDAQVANSCVVSAETLWRGARPNPQAAATLVELGVKTVVSLELLQDDRAAFETAAIRGREASEIRYFQVRDWEPLVLLAPGQVDEHVAQFLAIARTQPKPLYVHCRSGQNRTGIMVAAYKIFAGADIEATIADMERYGGFWSKSDADYLRTLTPQRRADIERRVTAWLPRVQPGATIRCAAGRCVFSAGAR